MTKPCPICCRPAEAPHQPFCSARCRDHDLGRWFTGRYAIPAEESADPLEADDEGE